MGGDGKEKFSRDRQLFVKVFSVGRVESNYKGQQTNRNCNTFNVEFKGLWNNNLN